MFTMEPGQPSPETPRQRAAARRAGEGAWRHFLFVFLLGAGIVWMLKVGLESPGFAAVAAAAIVVFYTVNVAQRPAVGRGTDVVDSIYYLGFLFTLVSLGIGLWMAGTAGAASVAGDFGIAIMSTVAGMLGRICLTIRREGSAEGMDDQVRMSLNEAGEKLQAEIRYAVADFGEFRDGLREQYREHVKSVSSFAFAMEKAVRTAQQRAEDLQKLATQGLTLPKEVEKTVKGFLAELQRTSESISQRAALIEKTGESLNGFVQAAEATGGRLKDEAARLEQKTFSAAKALEAAVARIERADLAGEVRRQFEQGGILVAAPKVEGLDDLRDAARSISEALAEIGRLNAELVEDVRGGIARLDGGARVTPLVTPPPPPWHLAFRIFLVAATVSLLVYLFGVQRGWWSGLREADAATRPSSPALVYEPPPPAVIPSSPPASYPTPVPVPDWYRSRVPPPPVEP